MATTEEGADKPARLPRGVKPVTKAFFTALDAIPDATRAAVAKAAQTMIRDQLKQRRDKLREMTLKEKEKLRRPAAAKSAAAKPATAKSAAAKPVSAKPVAAKTGTVKAKRRTRKPADTSAAA